MFQDYKVVITGATSGIRLATARLFIKEGATVIADRPRNFSKTKDLGDRFIPRICDVRDADEIVKTCDFIKETFDNELDVFVNNAGFGENTTIRDVTVDQFDRCLVFCCGHRMLFAEEWPPLLLNAPKNNASIINTASAASRTVSSENPLYNLAKNAVVLYTKQQAQGFIGVRCNSVSPGFIQTPIFQRDGVNMAEADVLAMYDQMAQVTCEPNRKTGRSSGLDRVFSPRRMHQYINGADVLIDGGLMTVSN